VRFERPLKFYRGQPRALTLALNLLRQPDGSLRARAVLRSTLQPARPELPAQVQVHFTGEVLLARSVPTPPPAPVVDLHGQAIERAAIYPRFFHGPAYQVLEQARLNPDRMVGVWRRGLPDDTAPAGGASVLGPRLVELCFQTAGLWELEAKHRLGLPHALGSLAVYAPPPPETALFAVVKALDDGARFEGCVVDEAGRVCLAFSDYQTIGLSVSGPGPDGASAAAG
jgi:hypothetical protein